jgi:catechol 2,3-dioxygenase-like lactoylglutathione lyase family enzyme
MLRPKALDHVGLIVTDLDRSLRFYKALGLELLRRSERCTGSSAVLKVGAQEINVFVIRIPRTEAGRKGSTISA